MQRLALRIVIFATLVLAAAPPAFATSSLSFDGGGYWIDLEIGEDGAPVIASVRFHAPGEADGVVLPRDAWQVETFDATHQVLVLRHPHATAAVESFTLSVQQRTAVLTIGDRRIESPFNWQQ